jgi:2-polyprenyl-6-methoxyphenol hydroxylase-like FAD-dependent oxidoreductase
MASTNVASSELTNGTPNGHTNGHTNGHINNHTNNPTQASPSTSLPIIIAGGGCVGLFFALLLSHTPNINPIIVVEPQTPDPTSTRAMAHQPPTYPLLSKIPGLLPELIKAGSLSSGLCFRTSVQNGSKVIAGKTFDNSGEGMKGKGQLLLPQGRFQGVLMERLRGREGVEVKIGSQVTGFSSKADSVTVHVQNSNGEEEEIEAAYLIGADGGHSIVRKSLGVEFEGETLDAQLVATDLHFDFKRHDFFDANFIIDPMNYGLIGRITNDVPPLWRVSYGVPIGMSDEEINGSVDKKLSGMLPNAGLNGEREKEYKVVRIAPYKAQQRCASTLYKDRVCLIGDAAHLTNPYAGLGLASGIADAASLAEVLAHILSSKAVDPELLLSSWSEARRKSFFDVVDKPSRMAYKRVRSDVGSEEKLEAFLGRDPLVGALKKGMPVMPPSLETKGEELQGW